MKVPAPSLLLCAHARALLVLLVAAGATGCYAPDVRDCVVACAANGACPDGTRCSNGYCSAARECPAFADSPQCGPCVSARRLHSLCRADVVLRCTGEQWIEERACVGEEPVCYQGACRHCRPGTWRCHDGCQEPCNVDGAWAGFSECTSCAMAPPELRLAAGWGFSCALDAGRVFCWGDGRHGQLGLRDPILLGSSGSVGSAPGQIEALAPIDLGAGRSVQALATGGRHACALLDDGNVKCWGDNSRGQLGLGDTDNRGDDPGEMGDALRAVDLGVDRYAVALAAGGQHTCVVLDGGDVRCWGAGAAGQLGGEGTQDRGDQPCEMGAFLPPVDLGGAEATALTAGFDQTCALLASGEARCWGGERAGPADVAGDGVAGAGMLTAIAAGHAFGCALDRSARLSCWGDNRAGQLGVETREPRSAAFDPVDPFVHLQDPIEAIATGDSHACAIVAGGGLKCWGLNHLGQLGIGAPGNRGDDPGEMYEGLPAVDLGSGVVTGIAAGADHTCAVLDGSRVKCWGLNDRGQLGLGDTRARGLDAADMGDALPEVPLVLRSR